MRYPLARRGSCVYPAAFCRSRLDVRRSRGRGGVLSRAAAPDHRIVVESRRAWRLTAAQRLTCRGSRLL